MAGVAGLILAPVDQTPVQITGNDWEEAIGTCGRRHVLLTTRASSTRKIATKIEIEKLLPESGDWLLLRCAGKIGSEATDEPTARHPEWEDAKAVATALDGLPLALDQAGAYLAEKELTSAD